MLNFDMPVNNSSIIKVIGVGGGGGNAVNHMYKQGITDVDFVVCNTDAQDLTKSPVPIKIQLGSSLTGGRGAGNKPDKGRQAAIESLPEIGEVLGANTKMVFITAGLGGGTGTGAAPVIAEEAQKLGILTVGIVTIPFMWEGKRRISQAIEGIRAMKDHVDSLLVINNEKLREIYGDLKFSQAFARADDVLTVAAKGIAEIITKEGKVNVDFEDVKTVMSKSGVALLGSAMAEGEGRAQRSIDAALSSPLLNNNNIFGATNILLNITSGTDEITMDEIGEITDFVQDAAGQSADIIWGVNSDEEIGDNVAVTIIATGFSPDVIPEIYVDKSKKIQKIPLVDKSVVDEIDLEEFTVEDELVDSDKFELKDNNDVDLNDEPSFTPNVDGLSPEIEPAVSPSDSRVERLGYLKSGINVDELENVPAYVRRKKKLVDNGVETSDDNDEVSRFTLRDDEDGIQIRKENRYLNDNVD